MTGLFGGLLGDPAERNEIVLRRDLELRRDGGPAGRWDGYAYRGSADLLLQHGRFQPGRRLPERWQHHFGQPSQCYINALLAAEDNPELTYCEGVYWTGQSHGRSHAWCLDPDGELVEVTFPTDEATLAVARSRYNLPYLPPERWGYWGVTFAAELVQEHLDRLDSLPMFDRPLGELADPDMPEWLDMSEPHDYPILKVPYDPNRRHLP